jgi:YfiH family protein
MILQNGVFISELLSAQPVIHGFTTRSRGNLGYGKSPGNPEVASNRQKLFSEFDLTERVHVQPHQLHTDSVLNASEFVSGQVADGSIANSPQYLLSVLTADCVPVLVYNPSGFVAAIHCGWRGLQKQIITKTLHDFDSRSVAVIGPAIGLCCYEVDDDLAAAFEAKFGADVVFRSNTAKPHLDLPAVALLQLQSCGVEQIEISHLCTFCHPDLFFSYRRDGSSGRMMSFIALCS